MLQLLSGASLPRVNEIKAGTGMLSCAAITPAFGCGDAQEDVQAKLLSGGTCRDPIGRIGINSSRSALLEAEPSVSDMPSARQHNLRFHLS